MMDPVGGEPVHALVPDPEILASTCERLLLVGLRPAVQPDQPGMPALAQREQDREALPAEACGERPGLDAPHPVQVRHAERRLVGHALEGEPQLMAHGRARPVGPDQPSRPDPDRALRPLQQRLDPLIGRRVRGEGDEAEPVADGCALGREGVREEPLGAALLEDPRPRERGVPLLRGSEVRPHAGTALPDPDPARCLRPVQHRRDQAQLIEDLHAAGLDHDRPRLPGRPGLRIHDQGRQPAAPGDEPRHQARRPRADDQQIGGQRGIGRRCRVGRVRSVIHGGLVSTQERWAPP